MQKFRIADYVIGGLALAAFFLMMVENTAFGDANRLVFDRINLALLSVFAGDVLARILLAQNKAAHLAHHWFDLIVFLPFLQYLPHPPESNVGTILRQAMLMTILLSRSRKANKLLSLLSLRPAQVMIMGFLFTIALGMILLMLPAATVAGERLGPIDALFTSTSAVCVTGLAVRDTATYFSTFGQVVILCLIQAGGLGIMTFSVTLAMMFGKQVDVRRKVALQGELDQDTLEGLRRMIAFIVGMTVVFELAGWAALFFSWQGRFESLSVTAFHSLFHSVSAFCNAGFSTFSDSLVRFKGDVWTNLFVCVLIVSGGLGFLVLRDLLSSLAPAGRGRRPSLRIQTKVVLRFTVILIVAGALGVYLFERNGVLGGMNCGNSFMSAFFQSVTARTAGFNTCDVSMMSSASLILIMALMFIGASPGSTAGGIKTTTLAVLFATVWSGLRHRERTEMHRRTVPNDVIRKALSLLCISMATVTLFAALLTHIDKAPLADALFESVSAFGTVGLSTGLTPNLGPSGKGLVALLMFVGRLGPLTIAYAFAAPRQAGRYEYAEERMMIG